jgi:SAM-dependent methyltransferase
VTSEQERYTHGHHESVLRSHRWRTADNSVAFALGDLREGTSLLDVGCGPGTITADLATRVAPGRVVGVDRSPDVVAEARRAFPATPGRNLVFEVGDVYALDYPDACFDAVVAHQVLQHLRDPVAALIEARRVTVAGGLLAVRDVDYAATLWWPPDPRLDRWLGLYHDLTRRNGAQADAGRRLAAWVRQAGWGNVVASSSTWTFASDLDRQWWGDLWAERVTASDLARQLHDEGLATTDELVSIADAFRQWSQSSDGLFVMVHGEVRARRPADEGSAVLEQSRVVAS